MAEEYYGGDKNISRNVYNTSINTVNTHLHAYINEKKNIVLHSVIQNVHIENV